ncbi:hypothetical protein E5161_01290 [Cohnella pontilimi]|uniref:Hsp20/alpha crystallin family protein n=1 Tax=Cohnella pontilimi TaxID=2564100 RepID=A0A4U0FGP5_9BACL|nr:Hsp20/alpha crystallin family protein [Cohnella pontilimi]TJY44060.1 hypothetical protein E5161_01290 [Cohnella pontilimi]
MNGDWKQWALNWRQFQKSLLDQMPFGGDGLNPRDVEGFVQDTINRFMPKTLFNDLGSASLHSSGRINFEIFETHRAVFVRCRFPERVVPADIRLFLNKRKLNIEGPHGTEEVLLPADVKASSATARFDDGILEIRMPKSKDIEPLKEIFIRDRS